MQPALASEPPPNRGAQFHRCALRVNPPGYLKRERGQEHGLTPGEYVARVFEICAEERIDAIAVTDHDDVSEIQRFVDASTGTGVTVFPGFEIASNEGIHVLCLYPPDTPIDRMREILGGVKNPSGGELSHLDFSTLLAHVEQQGGISVAAHVTGKNGLLGLSGRARVDRWRDERLLAVQIPGSISDLPQQYGPIVDNSNREYRRTHPVAVINAKDVARPEDLRERAATTSIKMNSLSIEGLRQAFLDPGSRIRLSSDPPPGPHIEFVTLSWQGGFLDGLEIWFNENLNVLIGGRGAGKSTVIESLRYVLDLKAAGEDAQTAHDKICKNVLRNGTKVTLRLRSPRPFPREYIIERTAPNPPVVRAETGELLGLHPSDVAPGVDVYGQHEISEVASGHAHLSGLLRRFLRCEPGRQEKDPRARLAQSRKRITETRAELEQALSRLEELPALEESLRRYREAGLEEKLKERMLIVREEQVWDKVIPGRIEPLREGISRLSEALPVDTAPLSPAAVAGLPNKGSLALAQDAIDVLSTRATELLRGLREELSAAETKIASAREASRSANARSQAEYERTLRELQRSNVDGEEFIQAGRRFHSLAPLRERADALRRALAQHEAERRELLVERENQSADEFRRMEDAAREIGAKLRDRVRIEVTFAGDRAPLEKLLRDRAGGRVRDMMSAFERVPAFSLRALAETCRNGAVALTAAFGLSPATAAALAQADPALFLEIEELDLPPTTRIELNIAAEGQAPVWKPLDELSKGQKATAILLILLLDSTAPLVIDQPEDDLDNRFISEVVVPKMREEKRRRQFIFATHNANIPVLGDAEMILALTAAGEAAEGRATIETRHRGSIDVPAVRSAVEDVLEGGRDAFQTRRRKYGF